MTRFVVCSFKPQSGYNTLELYNVLGEIQCTKSKTKLDTHYNKLGRQVSSKVAKQLQFLQNIRTITNLMKTDPSAHSLFKMKIFAKAAEKLQK